MLVNIIVNININNTTLKKYFRGDNRESNPGPSAPKAEIIPLDYYPLLLDSIKFSTIYFLIAV